MKLNDISAGVLIGCLLILLYTLACRFTSEGYTSKQEKAETIAKWWGGNKSNPSYVKYRKDIDQSDIVEYSKIKQLDSPTVEMIIGSIS